MAVHAKFHHHHEFLAHQLDNNSANPLNYVGQRIFNGTTVLSGPESELTCNNNNMISGSRKRAREDHQQHPQLQFQFQFQLAAAEQQRQKIMLQQQFILSNLSKGGQNMDKTWKAPISLDEENHMNGSGTTTSTSGRSSHFFASSSYLQDINSSLVRQNYEIDALIQIENEKLLSGLEEMRKKHYKSLLSVLDGHAYMQRLEEKETELVIAHQKSAQLEEKIKQLNAENQIWFNVAKDNEAIASNLRSSLEQFILHNQNQAGQAREGFGESCFEGGGVAGVGADEAQSCCNEVRIEDDINEEYNISKKIIQENCELKQRKYCKGCGENEVSVLVLPCRHLCLCKDCDSKLLSCPICNSAKNASLQIFIS